MAPATVETWDVVVAGAGAGGICAAIASARTGARTLLLERAAEIGGTGVHSPVGLVCKFHGSDHRPINLGIHQELFPEIYAFSTRDFRPSAPRLTYDHAILARRYRALVAATPRLTVLTKASIDAVAVNGRVLQFVHLADGRTVRARMFVDSTADGNLAALAGMRYEKGRCRDGAMQSATLTFGLRGIDRDRLRQPDYRSRGGLDALWAELTPLLQAAQAAGRTQNPKTSVVCFPYPDGERLLFNANEVLGVDPTAERLDEARARGEQFVHELVAVLREHPAFTSAKIDFISPWLGVREGRRVVGDYQLTADDCLGEARFEDMVAACAYEIDIHDPEGGPAIMQDIPGSGYYHIPLRSLRAADADNLLLGSRCISGTHEAHSSYRVISSVTALGQAAGTAAALAARAGVANVRAINAAQVRWVLRHQRQFVEGTVETPPGWSDAAGAERQ